MSDDRAQAIRHEVEGRRDGFLELLRDLVEIESPTTSPETQRAAFDRLAEGLESAGLHARIFSGDSSGGMLLAYPEERDRDAPLQLLVGHTDTVWPIGTLDRMPFRVEDGVAYGPGVFDMKGGLAQIVLALHTLREVDLSPPVTPVVFVNSDEETGSHDSLRELLRVARRCRRVFVLEPALGPEGKIKTARKGTGDFFVRVYGRAAHSGLSPDEGASAIVELARIIQEVHSLNDPARGMTVNVGVVEGGTRPNVIAAEARAKVDVRITASEQAKELERAFAALEPSTPGTRIEVDGGINRYPLERNDRNRALWEAAREAGREMGLELEQGISGGASDGNMTNPYAATLDGLGPVGGGAHAEDEHLRVDATLERAAFLARLLLLPPTGN